MLHFLTLFGALTLWHAFQCYCDVYRTCIESIIFWYRVWFDNIPYLWAKNCDRRNQDAITILFGSFWYKHTTCVFVLCYVILHVIANFIFSSEVMVFCVWITDSLFLSRIGHISFTFGMSLFFIFYVLTCIYTGWVTFLPCSFLFIIADKKMNS